MSDRAHKPLPCRRCGAPKDLSHPKYRSKSPYCHDCSLATRAEVIRRWADKTRDKRRLAAAKWYADNPEKSLVKSAKYRARRAGLPFSITPDDISIPDACPVLGIEMKKGCGRYSDGSPTLDRFDPDGGYTAENTRVISFRANRIKNNASLEELRLILKYMESK